jgi:hypothetical protein
MAKAVSMPSAFKSFYGCAVSSFMFDGLRPFQWLKPFQG